MEEEADVKHVVLEELKRLGILEVSRKKSYGSQGSKILGINTSSNASSKSHKTKTKIRRSPRNARSRSPTSRANTNKTRDERKHTPKSPFSSTKRKAEHRKQIAKEAKNKVTASSQGHVFGLSLEDVPSVCVYMTDGTQVTVAEFLVDVCNLIRRSITVEGIFRKAGSSNRQSDLKKLIDSNNSLPSNVHVIDGACLFKQFLRCLPEPLLPGDVHTKIVKCMELAEESRIEAITLCTLLLPQAHRHTLIYIMDFLTEVAASSSSNFMDAHNLAIVLAPNLLPSTITPRSSRKNAFQSVPSEDTLLTTNIEILQLMIENAPLLCRMPTNLALALEHRERSKSSENLLASQPHPASRKKRRSASIHRLMTGLRRVVGHSSGSSSPLRSTESIECLDSLHMYSGVTLSPAPTSGISPRKRKSADAFELGVATPRDAASDAHHISTPPSSKRVKVESEVGTAGASTTKVDTTPPAVSDSVPLTIITTATPVEKQSSKVGQPITIREVKDTRDVFTQPIQRASPMGDTKSNLQRPLSPKIGACSRSPGINFHTFHSGVIRQSIDRSESIGKAKEEKIYPRAFSSQLLLQTSPAKRPNKIKRRSCDVPLGGGVKRTGSFGDPVRVTRRNSFDWRSNGNEPDGADVVTLGPRGIPDGAECNLRDGVVPKLAAPSNPLETLEQHYDDIKAVVKTMEAEVDKSNVQQMKETYFPNSSSSSSQNMSYSEMIQNAYERMKVESKDLGISPSQNLSKRLDKELKIRNRKSSEHRVIRSPSERKIGTIRRRSRELVQNAAKNLITGEDTPIKPQQTPRMKEHLLQTPVNTSLRRGKPNSVKSGLPFVVRTFSPLQNEETPPQNSTRMVIVSKRVEESNVIQPLKVSKNSPYQQVSSHENSNNSDLDIKGSTLDLPSVSLDISNQSCDENLMDSILELLPGAMTRRRSSLLSSLPISFPDSSLENIHNSIEQGDSENFSCSSHASASNDHMEIEGNQESPLEDLRNKSTVLALPAVIFPEKDDEEQWMPATDFNYMEEELEPVVNEGNHGRPSLAALKKQKKVTANVQLFNKLHTVTPKRQSRHRSTPQQSIPQRSTASERRNARLSYSKSMTNRCTMTPRELLKARQRSFQFDRSPRNLAKIAVVSPLKESTWINIQQEHSQEVQKAFKGEATIPQPSAFNVKNFKPPVAPLTPVRPLNHHKNHPDTQASNPPKLPPRNIVKPSPIWVQYR